jgi:hypothetical protein
MKMEPYETGTGQVVLVHTIDQCRGRPCAIHNPSRHHMRDWPTHWRDDRMMMERMCKHGVGHPDPDDLAFKMETGNNDSAGIHGCCEERCCMKGDKDGKSDS